MNKVLKGMRAMLLSFLVLIASLGVVHAANYVETTSYDLGYPGIDLAEDSSGNIFIVDTNNQKIKKYDQNGNYLLQFGAEGTGNGEFSYVSSIAIDSSGNVFVADEVRVQKFTNNGAFLSIFAATGEVKGMAIDAADNVYVSLPAVSQIAKYSSAGALLGSFGTLGDQPEEFDSPGSLTIDAAGNIYVADEANKRMQVFSSGFEYLYEVTGFGPAESWYIMPFDIDVSPAGETFVADTYNNIVKVYDNTGLFLSSIDVPGNPYGIIAKSNVILVSVAGDTTLRRFTLDDLAPTINVTPFDSHTVATGRPNFEGLAVDTMSPVTSVEFKVEGGAYTGDWANCSASDDSYDSLSEAFTCIPADSIPVGSYTLSVRATDNVANTNRQEDDNLYTYTFSIIDDAPASIDNEAFPEDKTFDTTPLLTGTVIDLVSGIVSVEYELTSENPGVWHACVSEDGAFDELTEVYQCQLVDELNVGINIVTIRSTDASGFTNEPYPDGNAWEYTFEVRALTTPSVSTGAASSVTASSAVIGGTVTSNGGSVVNERGIVYSATVTNPTVSDIKVVSGMGVGVYTASLSSLAASTHYYARAYASNAQGTAYGSVIEFTTLAAAPTTPASLQNVYVTFAKFKYNKYVSPSALRTGDTVYIKNYNTSKLKLLQVFLYDYAKKGNQGFTKSKVTTSSMFLRTTSLLPTGKRYAYVFKFQDKATGIIATKYFVVYTTKVWQGKSVLGVTTAAEPGVQSKPAPDPSEVAPGYVADPLPRYGVSQNSSMLDRLVGLGVVPYIVAAICIGGVVVVFLKNMRHES